MKTLCSAIVLLLASCASHPPPSQHLASAIAAARGAQEAGAQQVPQAALHLKLAEEQIAQARQMMDEGNNLRADYMTLRAYNDAELALALAREQAARQRAMQVEAQVATPTNAGAPTHTAPSTTAAPTHTAPPNTTAVPKP